jgi:hypothetical protein
MKAYKIINHIVLFIILHHNTYIMTSECDSIGIKNDESYTMSGVSLERINLK